MALAEVDAVVVGAGIAGLAAALELQSAGCEVLVVDPSDRPGGALRTDHQAGYVYECGANTTLVKGPMRRFLERRKLADRLLRASPDSKRRYLFRDGELVRVPTSAPAFFGTPLLSWRGKLRLASEPLRRRGDPRRESVAEFLGRRLGDEAVENLVGPFLTGVYAGDERELGAASVFPRLAELERGYGSLALGGLASAVKRGDGGLRGSYATQQGFGPLARQLAEGLAEPPALGSRVATIARDGERWRADVRSASGDFEVRAARMVVSAPAFAAADLLRALDAELAEALAGIAYAPLVVAPVGVEPRRSRVPIEGFGFLVPRSEGLGLLGCLFSSRLFPGRAPEGRELLHCMLGGVRWPDAVELPDDALHERLAGDLERTLGLSDAPAPLAWLRWPRAVPQPSRDHAERIDWVQKRVDACPGLALAGSYVAGVGVADALASGLAAAARVLDAVPRR